MRSSIIPPGRQLLLIDVLAHGDGGGGACSLCSWRSSTWRAKYSSECHMWYAYNSSWHQMSGTGLWGYWLNHGLGSWLCSFEFFITYSSLLSLSAEFGLWSTKERMYSRFSIRVCSPQVGSANACMGWFCFSCHLRNGGDNMDEQSGAKPLLHMSRKPFPLDFVLV